MNLRRIINMRLGTEKVSISKYGRLTPYALNFGQERLSGVTIFDMQVLAISPLYKHDQEVNASSRDNYGAHGI